MEKTKPEWWQYTADRLTVLDDLAETLAKRLAGSYDGAAEFARKFIEDHKGPDGNGEWVIFADPPWDPTTGVAYGAYFPQDELQTSGLCSEPARKALVELLKALPEFVHGDHTSRQQHEQQNKLRALCDDYLERRGLSKVAEVKQPKGTRGRKKADYETIEREAALAAEWQRARESGVYKADFGKQHGMTARKLGALLDRVAKRKKRARR
jgi:hypothetical protein